MNKFERAAVGILATTGLACGSLALAGCGSESTTGSLTGTQKLEQQNRDLDHFESDFAGAQGIILENDRYVQIPFTGDFFTPPTDGLKDGALLGIDQIAQVDLAAPEDESTPNCQNVSLPMDAGKLTIKVVVNNASEPIYARASGQTLELCNTLEDIPASVGIQATIKQ